jgi:hypothetical protein
MDAPDFGVVEAALLVHAVEHIAHAHLLGLVFLEHLVESGM